MIQSHSLIFFPLFDLFKPSYEIFTMQMCIIIIAILYLIYAVPNFIIFYVF